MYQKVDSTKSDQTRVVMRKLDKSGAAVGGGTTKNRNGGKEGVYS